MVIRAASVVSDCSLPPRRSRTASNASAPIVLPVELQLLVIQHAVDAVSPSPSYTDLPERYALLTKFALVCRTWAALIRPLLHRDLLFSTPSQAQLFLRSVSASSKEDDRPKRIRTLRIGRIPWLGKTYEEMGDEQEALIDAGEDLKAAAEISGLAEHFRLRELLEECAGLEDLWLAGVSHCLLSDLRPAVNLRSFHLLRTSICDCDYEQGLPALPFTFPLLTRLEVYTRSTSSTTFATFFSSKTFPSLRHFSYACMASELPSSTLVTSIPSLTTLSTVTDIPTSISTSTSLLLLDAYQLPIREAIPYLPSSLRIIRLNDLNPLQSFPWLLVDHATSDALAARLPNLTELWLPGSYTEWRDDRKLSVREMVRRWVKGWEDRGVRVVFESDDEDEEKGARGEDAAKDHPELRRMTERAAWDWTFTELGQRLERSRRNERV
ncbi:hypothetical protein JCM8097_008220 [Rhodosporidiobolus ruineniae]